MRYLPIALCTVIALFVSMTTICFGQAIIQQPPSKTRDIEAVTISARRLTASDIFDSVVKYATTNYPLVPAFSCNVEIALATPDTTYLKYNGQVFLTRPLRRLDEYWLYLPKNERPVPSINILSENQKLRVTQVHVYPNNQSITEGLKGMRRMVGNNPTLFATSILGDSVKVYQVIVKLSDVRNSLLLARNSEPVPAGKTTIGVFRAVINPQDWSLLHGSYAWFNMEDADLETFRSKSTYSEADAFLSHTMPSTDQDKFFVAFDFMYSNQHRGYIPQNVQVKNGFYPISSSVVKRASNPERSVYYYLFTDFTVLPAHPEEAAIFLIDELREAKPQESD